MMKLEDWPIEDDGGGFACMFEPTRDGEPCRMYLDAYETAKTLGELARSIVEHAKAQHGIDIERAGSWYESYTPSGNLWCGSSSVDDFTTKDLDGMEGEELTHWTLHNAKMAELTYRRIGTYMVDVVEEWSPLSGSVPLFEFKPSMAPSWARMDMEVMRIARRRVERLEAESLRYLVACVPFDELTIVDVLGHDDHVMHVSQVDDYVDSLRRGTLVSVDWTDLTSMRYGPA